ncbi:MAG: hypothetical protein SFY92_00125, partial [Verrucomicrobiae bacterium]|nr:hypothetical protein [Verrucomicrobiae bacterium]
SAAAMVRILNMREAVAREQCVRLRFDFTSVPPLFTRSIGKRPKDALKNGRGFFDFLPLFF